MFDYKKNLTNIWMVLSMILTFGFIIFLFLFIFTKGYESLTLDFIFSKPIGTPVGAEGGIFPAIIGTMCFVLIGTFSAFIVSISIAIYNQFYLKNKRISNIISRVINIINGIPSIILGLFGYSFFVIYLDYGISVLSGGLVLGLMIFPNMETRFEKCFSELNSHYRYSAYALGVNKIYYIIKILIPLNIGEIISIITLSSSFAMGATAPIMLTGAVYYASNPDSIFSPAMALPTHLYMLLGESVSKEKAFATASVLLILLVAMNLISWVIAAKWRIENE